MRVINIYDKKRQAERLNERKEAQLFIGFTIILILAYILLGSY